MKFSGRQSRDGRPVFFFRHGGERCFLLLDRLASSFAQDSQNFRRSKRVKKKIEKLKRELEFSNGRNYSAELGPWARSQLNSRQMDKLDVEFGRQLASRLNRLNGSLGEFFHWA